MEFLASLIRRKGLYVHTQTQAREEIRTHTRMHTLPGPCAAAQEEIPGDTQVPHCKQAASRAHGKNTQDETQTSSRDTRTHMHSV